MENVNGKFIELKIINQCEYLENYYKKIIRKKY